MGLVEDVLGTVWEAVEMCLGSTTQLVQNGNVWEWFWVQDRKLLGMALGTRGEAAAAGRASKWLKNHHQS